MKMVTITTEYIKLQDLLKLAVLVNGEVCTQRGRKIRPDDTVDYHGLLLGVRYADQ